MHAIDPFHRALHHVAPAALVGQTAQTSGMNRLEAISGKTVFLDVDGDEAAERRIETEPGDYVFVPPFVPHREENPDPEHEAVVVIARTTQEAIVVNLRGLDWAEVDTADPPASPSDAPARLSPGPG